MKEIDLIKALARSLDEKNKSNLLGHIQGIEKKILRDEFLIDRNKKDSKVNANFIRKTVERLEESNKKLVETNLNLKQLNLELEYSNEELERFAYIASHDLKTPLNNIISFSKLLEEELKDHPEPRVKEYLAFVQGGGARMNTLIKSILEFSKLTRVEEEKQDINLNAIVTDVTQTISNFITNRKAIVVLDNVLPTIHYYESEMLKLFQNLIENGIKYNQSPTPTVRIFSKYQEGQLCICFKDNGIGIDPKHFGTITKMFSRLHRESEYEGSGLGLSICQKILTRLEGQLVIESDGSNGSMIAARFPIDLD